MEKTKSGSVSIFRDLVSQIGKSALMAFPPIRRFRLRFPRTSCETDMQSYLERNAFYGLQLLLDHAGGVKSKQICEIGPGDDLSSGFSMLAAGAQGYTAIDRFPGNYSSPAAKEVYRQIEINWSKFYPNIARNQLIDAATFPEGQPDLVKLSDRPIEAVRLDDKFDIICSFQTGEHVSDINAFAKLHDDLLTSDGVGLHRVDMGPHDVWSDYADPTTFLRFSDSLWRMTGANRGIPNRKRHHEFIEAFTKTDLNVEVLEIKTFESNSVEYEKLNKKFRSMPRESVMVKTAVYRLTRRKA